MTNEERQVLSLCRMPYTLCYVDRVNFEFCSLCPVDQARGRDKTRLNELFIMLDTETSKTRKDELETFKGRETYKINPNYIVAWSCAINIYGLNIMTVYGDSPLQIPVFLEKLHDKLPGNKTIIYCHNLSYDYVFTRLFLFDYFGFPKSQLNTKPHYPISIEFSNGICFRDSMILAQRGIEKWGIDMNVPDAKAVGKWDYNKIRNQGEAFTEDELKYIECDVLAGVECLNALRRGLKCSYSSFPYTNTGIVRNYAKQEGKKFNAHKKAVSYYYKSYEVYKILTKIYHGGYTHANRHISGRTIKGNIQAFDISSSYPFCLLSEKMPCERFTKLKGHLTEDEILTSMEKNAFIFRFRARNVVMKNLYDPFPVLQLSKCERVIDAVIDNGRIREVGYIDIYLNEVDFSVISACYKWEECDISDVYTAIKDYLPKWLRDAVYSLYKDKCFLKGGDAILYAIRKGMLNSIY